MGRRHRWGRTAGGGTDRLPRSPKTQFLCQVPPPGGPRARSSMPPAAWWAGGTWGRKGPRLDCAQLQGKCNVSRACPMCVCGGIPHRHCPLPTVVPAPPPAPPTPARGPPQPLKPRARWLPWLHPSRLSTPAPQEPLTRAWLSRHLSGGGSREFYRVWLPS